MLKLIIWIILLVGLIMSTIWVKDNPGDIVIHWLGYEITASIIAVIIAFLAILFGTILLVSTVARLFNIPLLFSHKRSKKKQEKGMSDLTMAFTSLASADYITAEKHIKKSKKSLGKIPLVQVLNSQISYAQGKNSDTVKSLESMLDNKQTKFIAAKALSNLSLQGDDINKALSYGEQALNSNPNDKLIYKRLLNLYIQTEEWRDGERLITRGKSKKTISKQLAAHYFATLYFASAVKYLSDNKNDSAKSLLEKSLKQEPAFLPAILKLAEIHKNNNEASKLHSIIKKAWKLSPHPDLLALSKEIFPTTNAKKLATYLKQLSKSNPRSIYSKIAFAEAAIASKNWGEAKQHLNAALGDKKLSSIYRLLAEIEREQNHNESAALEWLEEAMNCKLEPAWVCSKCHAVSGEWQTNCPSCNSFDTIQWQDNSGNIENKSAPKPLLLQ